MRAYMVDSPAHETRLVFATSGNDAANIIVTWQIANGIDASEFTIDPFPAKRLPASHTKTLREALQWGQSGMARYDQQLGWVVESVRDERE